MQHELIANDPYRLTQPDVLFESWLRRQPDWTGRSPGARDQLRQEFFARPQACLRSSPLPRKYGWGLVFDEAGRVALCPVGSEEYRRLITSGEVTVVKALRSRRA